MAHPRFVICFTVAALVAGCASSLPTCGSVPAGTACSAPWTSVLGGAQPLPQRNYATNPVTLPVPMQTVQPSFGATPGEEYRTVAVNTPSGIVYKRCKVLDGQVVACF